MELIYRMGTASRAQIYAHLEKCDGDFPTPLSSMVDLPIYADKLHEKAVSFEAWEGDALVGMLNAYLNDIATRTGFITNVSILREYRGKGVGSILLQTCLEHARRHQFRRIGAEVSPHNVVSLGLFFKFGFKVMQERNDTLLLEWELTRESTEELQ